MSRPRGAPSSNGSRARPCRASLRWKRADALPGEPPIAVLVHDRPEAEAALGLAAAAGRAVELVVPVGIAGPAFAKALEDLLGHPVTAWCDDLPGLALEAIRVGLREIVLEPETDAGAARRLADLAAGAGARLRTALPAPLFAVAPDRRRLLPATLGAGTESVP